MSEGRLPGSLFPETSKPVIAERLKTVEGMVP